MIRPLAAPLVSALALLAGSPAAHAADKPWTAPRLSFGQPDLGDTWSNVSMTPEVRPAGFGTRAAYTLKEAESIERASQKALAAANEKTDPNAPAPSVGGDRPPPGTRPEFALAGGNVGGYNSFWLDPGNAIMRVRGEPRTSILTTPDGRVPPTLPGSRPPPEWRGGLGSFDNPENRSLGERCIMGFGRNAGPPMLANGFYNNDYQFIQTPDAVAIIVEMNHDVRYIRLNGKHRTDDYRPWMGDSIGHWEGDTLVVETDHIPQAQAYHGSWKALKVTERFTRTAPDRLLYQFTIDDPSLWAAPWGGEYEFSPLKGQVYEYACHEGNYALRNMLAGARQEEKRAAEKLAAEKAAADKAAAATAAQSPKAKPKT
jgi:hypothetical protein